MIQIHKLQFVRTIFPHSTDFLKIKTSISIQCEMEVHKEQQIDENDIFLYKYAN